MSLERINTDFSSPFLNPFTYDSTAALSNADSFPLFSQENPISTIPINQPLFSFNQTLSENPFDTLNFSTQSPSLTNFSTIGSFDCFTPNYGFNSFNPGLYAISGISNEQIQVFINSLNQLATQYEIKTNFDFLRSGTNETSYDGTAKTYNAQELQSRWKKAAPHLKASFYDKVCAMADRLNCNADDLMTIMYSESGLKHDTCLKDKKTGRVRGGGLIGFMRSTAESECHMPIEQLLKLSEEEQLELAEKIFTKTLKKVKTKPGQKIDGATLYCSIFVPARVNNDVVLKPGDKGWDDPVNQALNYNHDNAITKDELYQRLVKKRKEALA